MKYVTDDEKMMKVSEAIEDIVEGKIQVIFDRSGWLSLDEQMYQIDEVIEVLKGLKDIYNGEPNLFYDKF